MSRDNQYGVVILGAGLAGLSLCRQLLLNGCGERILLIDNRADLPGKKQKVGESLVQVAGYYFTRILDLEEHLLLEHYPKYNLRFHWKAPGKQNRALEDYCVSFIRTVSNVSTYQLDRNRLEAHLLELNLSHPSVALCAPAASMSVDLSESGLHRIRFKRNDQPVEIQTRWVVDTTGRGRLLQRKRMLQQESPIRHGASWCWVEGLVNIERLTALSRGQVRSRRDQQKQGLFPMWLATNHFCGEGFWFWVIPLHHKTSLGLVYDKAAVSSEDVATPEKLIEWACREFPLFEHDLPGRKILDSARLADYAYDCQQTLSPSGWAMSGMAGRFSDPLYSPGSDLIGFYNTLIADAILEPDGGRLRQKCELYEPLMRVLYEAYIPSYSASYDVLGDQEVFTLKYAWELAVYFSFYAFPFINDLFTDSRFLPIFFRKFAQLGPINRNLQKFLSDYYQWKKAGSICSNPAANDFKELTPLKQAEMAYYHVVQSIEETEAFLDDQLRNLKEFARFIVAYVASVVLEKKQLLLNRSFVESLKLRELRFDPEEMRARWQAYAGCTESYPWKLDPLAMEKFRRLSPAAASPVAPPIPISRKGAKAQRNAATSGSALSPRRRDRRRPLRLP
ncbi:MAG: hypothetical protein HYX74_05280 [Acidobacteria bacterium]|nr:hypothetical protein [Acidobacteriota bacterium]